MTCLRSYCSRHAGFPDDDDDEDGNDNDDNGFSHYPDIKPQDRTTSDKL